MKLRLFIILLLSVAILAFPSVGSAYTQESFLDETETVEECERISESRAIRFLARVRQAGNRRYFKNITRIRDDFSTDHSPNLTVPKRYIVNRVLRL